MEDLGALLHRLQDESGFRAEALDLVLSLIRRQSLRHGIGGVGVHLEPPQVAGVVFATIREKFGPLARDVLQDWGLTSPAALGQALAVLSEAGLLAWGEEDGPEEYAHLAPLPSEWPHPFEVPGFREQPRWEPLR